MIRAETEKLVRDVARGKSINEALGSIGMYTVPTLGVRRSASVLSEEGWLNLIAMNPADNSVVINVQGTKYVYTLPADIYQKFDKMWNTYGAGGKAFNWMKQQSGVSFKKG